MELLHPSWCHRVRLNNILQVHTSMPSSNACFGFFKSESLVRSWLPEILVNIPGDFCVHTPWFFPKCIWTVCNWGDKSMILAILLLWIRVSACHFELKAKSLRQMSLKWLAHLVVNNTMPGLVDQSRSPTTRLTMWYFKRRVPERDILVAQVTWKKSQPTCVTVSRLAVLKSSPWPSDCSSRACCHKRRSDDPTPLSSHKEIITWSPNYISVSGHWW